jgi:hypothetical protein
VRKAQPPRQIPLDLRRKRQKGFAPDAYDQFAVVAGMRDKRKASIRFGIAPDEERRQASAPERHGQLRSRHLRGDPHLLPRVAFRHGSYLYLHGSLDATCI